VLRTLDTKRLPFRSLRGTIRIGCVQSARLQIALAVVRKGMMFAAARLAGLRDRNSHKIENPEQADDRKKDSCSSAYVVRT